MTVLIKMPKNKVSDLVAELPHGAGRSLVRDLAGRDDDQTFDIGLLPARE